ncbi:MAG TPA: hypothetical protein VKH35_11580 [Thermoanaerobaculia bacterium]|nr:hypothetical protein [Thermoanaerobaculia bacterium]
MPDERREGEITKGAFLLWIAWIFAWIFPRRREVRYEPDARQRPAHDHERSDASVKGVALALTGLALFLVGAALLPRLLLPWIAAEHGRPNPAHFQRFTLPPEPRLQADPIGEFAARRAVELKILESSGKGRIPIEQAMRIVAHRGVGSVLPPLPNANPATTTAPTSTTGVTPWLR